MVHASMGDRGASAFMHALSCNAVIRTLSVKDNKLSSQGFLYVLNGILRRADPTGSASVLRTGSSEAATRVRGSSRRIGPVGASSALACVWRADSFPCLHCGALCSQ